MIVARKAATTTRLKSRLSVFSWNSLNAKIQAPALPHHTLSIGADQPFHTGCFPEQPPVRRLVVRNSPRSYGPQRPCFSLRTLIIRQPCESLRREWSSSKDRRSP